MTVTIFLLICFVSFISFVIGITIGYLSCNVTRSDEKSLVNLANSVREGKCASFCIEVDKRELINSDDLEEMDDFFPELRRWEQN